MNKIQLNDIVLYKDDAVCFTLEQIKLPLYLILDKTIPNLAKMLWGIVNEYLSDCKETNVFFAQHLGVSKVYVSKMISKLIKAGYMDAVRYTDEKGQNIRVLLTNHEEGYE